MAKNWTISGEVMVRVYTDATPDLEIILSELFPDIEEMEDVQVSTIVNGVKQKLDDCIARSKDMKLTEAEKRDVQSTLWTRISEEREWNMPKATGARGPAVSYKVVIPALEASGLDAATIAATLGTTLERVLPFMKKEEEKVTEE